MRRGFPPFPPFFSRTLLGPQWLPSSPPGAPKTTGGSGHGIVSSPPVPPFYQNLDRHHLVVPFLVLHLCPRRGLFLALPRFLSSESFGAVPPFPPCWFFPLMFLLPPTVFLFSCVTPHPFPPSGLSVLFSPPIFISSPSRRM